MNTEEDWYSAFLNTVWSLQLPDLLLRLYSEDVTLCLKGIILQNKTFSSSGLPETPIAHLSMPKGVQGVNLKEDFCTFYTDVYLSLTDNNTSIDKLTKTSQGNSLVLV